MKPAKKRNVRFSINGVLLTLFVCSLTPALLFTYLSIHEATRIHSRILNALHNDAIAELEFALGNIATDAVKIAAQIAILDDTATQLKTDTAYVTWHDTQLKEISRFQPALTDIALFQATGESLTQGINAFPSEITQHSLIPSLVYRQNTTAIQYFHPIVSRDLDTNESVVSGYVGVLLDLPTYLIDRFLLRYSSNVSWSVAANETIPIQNAIDHAQLSVVPSDDIQALNSLVTTRFRDYLFYLSAIVALVIGLIVWAFAHPLRRLSNSIQELRNEKIQFIDNNIQGLVSISELDNVRLAINEYHQRFQYANQKLLEKNQELLQMTYRDALTGCFNRRAFETHLDNVLATARQENRQHAVLYLDLDQFKIVNDVCGHLAGDELLRQIAARLQNEIREADLLARLGGDEFGVILENCAIEHAARIAQNLCNVVQELRFSWHDKLFDVGASIGLVPIDANSGTVTDVLVAADSACYVAKDLGRNRVHVYQADDRELTIRIGQMQWITRINHALEHNRFVLFAQKIIPIQGESQAGKSEILLRLRQENGELIPPMAFLPAAERYNLMPKIDRWVVSETMRYLNYHPAIAQSESTVSINLSGQSLGDTGFLSFVLDELNRSAIAPARLCFEITETAAITNLGAATEFISRLRQRGCRFALDDFGSGLSSFSYLKTLSVDFLKIDGNFVRNMLNDPLSYSIVDSINQIGHVMGLVTIAEFVESTELLSVLRDIQIDYAQGYYVGEPELLA